MHPGTYTQRKMCMRIQSQSHRNTYAEMKQNHHQKTYHLGKIYVYVFIVVLSFLVSL